MASFGVGINPYSINTPVSQAPRVNSVLPQCNLIWVDDEEGVLNHPAAPNEQLYFGSRKEQVMYVRETDPNGKIKNPLHKLYYRSEDLPFGPEANFVTKDEHKQLYDLVEKMSQQLAEQNSKLEQLLS